MVDDYKSSNYLYIGVQSRKNNYKIIFKSNTADIDGFSYRHGMCENIRHGRLYSDRPDQILH